MPAYGTLVWAVVAIVVGAAVGRLVRVASARGRRPASVRWWGLFPAGLALRALVEVVDLPGGVVLLLASYALLLVGLWRNLAWTGTPIVALGLAACALVVSVDGGTSVSADALEAVGHRDRAGAGGSLAGERHLEQERDRLAVLGDVVPVPLTGHVTSFGELVALVGLADVAFNAASRRPARRTTGPTTDGPTTGGPAADPSPADSGPAAVGAPR
ncbi:MAG: hypothetical protein GEV08_20445 [Acidimicrobiia bacterium]|nr:hypothetical protein [Acidimicrobiia bacterium]